MKHLRASLECGDMIAAKSGLLSPEEAIQDLAHQLGDEAPSKVGLETFVRQADTDIVMPPSYAVTSLEGMSDGMAHLIAAVIAGIILLIVKFGDWFNKKSSGSGSGGGTSYVRIRWTISENTEDSLKKQRDRFKDLNQELNRRGPTLKVPTKDLNGAPAKGPDREEMVRNMDDVVDVVYRDIKSDDQQEVMGTGDPIIADIVDKKAHSVLIGDFSMAAASVANTVKQILDIVKGAAQHDISQDLSEGLIRDVYKHLPSETRWTQARLTMKEIATNLKATYQEIKDNPTMRPRPFTKLSSDLVDGYMDLGLSDTFSHLDPVPKYIEELQPHLERMSKQFESFQTDGNEKSAAVKEAVDQFAAWLRGVGELISGVMVTTAHLISYQDTLLRSLAKFASVGDFAVSELSKHLEPHERHEIDDSVKALRQSTKEIKQLPSPKGT